MKKRILAAALSLCMALALMPVPALAAEGTDAPHTGLHVFYHQNGGAGLQNDPTEYTEGDAVTLQGAGVMHCSGQQFVGWNTKPDGSGTAYRAGQTLTLGGTDTILYAQWEAAPAAPASYDLVYADASENVLDRKTVLNGDSVTVKAAYGSADSWNTRKDGTGASYDPGEEMAVWRDTVLYAVSKKAGVKGFIPTYQPAASQPLIRIGDVYTASYDGLSFFQKTVLDQGGIYASRLTTENGWWRGFFQRNSTFESVRVGGALLLDSEAKELSTIVAVFAQNPSVCTLESPGYGSNLETDYTLVKYQVYTPGQPRAPLSVTREDIIAAFPDETITDGNFPGYLHVGYVLGDATTEVNNSLFSHGGGTASSPGYCGVNADPIEVSYRYRDTTESPVYKDTEVFTRPNLESYTNRIVGLDPNLGGTPGATTHFQAFTYFDTTSTRVELADGQEPLTAYEPGAQLKLKLTVTNDSTIYRNAGTWSFIRSNALEYVVGSAKALTDDFIVAQGSPGPGREEYLPKDTTFFPLTTDGTAASQIVLAPGESRSFEITVQVKDGFDPNQPVWVESASFPRGEVACAHFDDHLVLPRAASCVKIDTADSAVMGADGKARFILPSVANGDSYEIPYRVYADKDFTVPSSADQINWAVSLAGGFEGLSGNEAMQTALSGTLDKTVTSFDAADGKNTTFVTAAAKKSGVYKVVAYMGGLDVSDAAALAAAVEAGTADYCYVIVPGDMNKSGGLDIADVMALNTSWKQTPVPTAGQENFMFELGDVNISGGLDIADVSALNTIWKSPVSN